MSTSKKSLDVDVARLYHTCSENVRARTVEMNLDGDDKPARRLTFPGAPRAELGGRDLRLGADFGEVLSRRRSVRSFTGAPLPRETLGRLLHATNGCLGRRRAEGVGGYRRPAPSAGGLYPIELYALLFNVASIEDGVYHYDAVDHEVEQLDRGRKSEALIDLTMGQDMVREANLVVVLSAARERTMYKYGQRGYRFLYLDAGHVGQNLYLAATALGLGPVGIGGFLDREIAEVCRMPKGEDPLYVLAVGWPAAGEVES